MGKPRSSSTAAILVLTLAASGSLGAQSVPTVDLGAVTGALSIVGRVVPEALSAQALAELSQLSQLGQLGQLGELAALAPLSELSQLSNELAPLSELGGGPRWHRGVRIQSVPPAPDPQATDDPADSLYKEARTALNRGEYRRAAQLFEQITQRYPKSTYAADALYWRAFALQRMGRDEDLRTALEVLDRQKAEFPGAATKGDAAQLAVRIKGELARRGDPRFAEDITTLAQGAAPARPANPATPAAPATPAVANEPADPRPPRTPRSARSSRDERRRSDLSQCPDDDDDTRMAALNALQQMDASRALPILKRVLARRDDCSAALRRKAVFLVAQQETNESADILLEAARTDPDVEVRRQAVFWLGQVDSERAVDILDSLLRTSSDDEVRDKAIFALSQHDSPRSGQILRNFAEQNSAPEELREKAIFWLGQQDRDQNAAFLRGLYGRLTDQKLKEKVLFSLSQMHSRENERWLLDVALNDNEAREMRKKALFWAGQSDLAVSELLGLYDKMTDREMREQLIFVYSQRDDAAAVDKLLDIARREPDRELKKKAIFWLSQSDDPRVAKFLEDILNQ